MSDKRAVRICTKCNAEFKRESLDGAAIDFHESCVACLKPDAAELAKLKATQRHRESEYGASGGFDPEIAKLLPEAAYRGAPEHVRRAVDESGGVDRGPLQLKCGLLACVHNSGGSCSRPELVSLDVEGRCVHA